MVRSNEIPDERKTNVKKPKQINTLSDKYGSVSGPLPFNKPERTPLSNSLDSKDVITKKSRKVSPSEPASGPLLSNSFNTQLSLASRVDS